MTGYEYKLQGLGCANCAAKIERQVSDLPWVKSARVDFATATLFFDPADQAAINERAIKKIVKDIEPEVVVLTASDTPEEHPKRNRALWEIAFSILFFVLAIVSNMLFSPPSAPVLLSYIGPAFYVLSAIVAGKNVFIQGVKQGVKLKLDENTLMSIAVVAALLMGEFFEGAMVALLFKIGEYLEELAVGKSRKQIEALAEIRPDHANILDEHGHITETDAQTVSLGQTIVIRPFERVPLDCTVLRGDSEVDSAAITGESVPRAVSPGSDLSSGFLNQGGLLEARVTNVYADSAASRIIEMVRSASAQKASAERTITKFARVYTPIVVLSALVLSLLPPLLGFGVFTDWLMRGLVFLVASCPCALVISVPLGFFSSIGGAGKKGILIKGGKYVEALAKTQAVAFDKTGTLTQGILKIDEVLPVGTMSKEEFLALAAAAEQHSVHPIAQAIVAAGKALPLPACRNYIERPGLGVVCETEDGRTLTVGRRKLLDTQQIDLSQCPEGEVYVALDGVPLGVIRVSDTVRSSSSNTVKWLKAHGVQRVVMLTGDSEPAARRVAAECGITEFYHSLFPQDKVEQMKRIREEAGGCVFVGDGINDAPVLAASSCGVAMGLGSQAAIEAADMVLTSGTPDRLTDAIALSRRAMRVIKLNITFALGCKFAVLALAAFGMAPMWLAVFADVGVTILCVLVSSRLGRVK